MTTAVDWSKLDDRQKLDHLMRLFVELRGEVAALRAADAHTLLYVDRVHRSVREVALRLDAIGLDVEWSDASPPPGRAKPHG